MWLTHDADELNEAIRENSRDMVHFHQIISSREFCSDVKDSQGYTSQIVACQEGCLGLVDMLQGFGADVNRRDNAGWTAGMHAIVYGHVDVFVRILRDPALDLHKRAFSAEENQIQPLAVQRRNSGRRMASLETLRAIPKRLPCASKVHPCAFFPEGMSLLGLASACTDTSFLSQLFEPITKECKRVCVASAAQSDWSAVATARSQAGVVQRSFSLWRAQNQQHVLQDTLFSSIFNGDKAIEVRAEYIRSILGDHESRVVNSLIDGVSSNLNDLPDKSKAEHVLSRSFSARYVVEQQSRELRHSPIVGHFDGDCAAFVADGQTALHVACEHGKARNLSILCSNGHPLLLGQVAPTTVCIERQNWDCLTVQAEYFDLSGITKQCSLHTVLQRKHSSESKPPQEWPQDEELAQYLRERSCTNCRGNPQCRQCLSNLRVIAMNSTEAEQNALPRYVAALLSILRAGACQKQAKLHSHRSQFLTQPISTVIPFTCPALEMPAMYTTGNTYFPLLSFVRSVSSHDLQFLDTMYMHSKKNRVLASSMFMALVGDFPVYGPRTKQPRTCEYARLPLAALHGSAVYAHLQLHRYSLHLQALLLRKLQWLKRRESDVQDDIARDQVQEQEAKELTFSTDAPGDVLPSVVPLSVHVPASLLPSCSALGTTLEHLSPSNYAYMEGLAAAYQGKAHSLRQEYLRAVQAAAAAVRKTPTRNLVLSPLLLPTASSCPHCHPLFQFLRMGLQEPDNDAELTTLLLEVSLLSLLLKQCITCKLLQDICQQADDWVQAGTRAGYSSAVRFMAQYKFIGNVTDDYDYIVQQGTQDKGTVETLLGIQAGINLLLQCLGAVQRGAERVLGNLNLVIDAWYCSSTAKVKALKSSYEYVYDTWYNIHTTTLNSSVLHERQYVEDIIPSKQATTAARQSTGGLFDKQSSDATSLLSAFKKKDVPTTKTVTELTAQVHSDHVYKENYLEMIDKENFMLEQFTLLDDHYSEISKSNISDSDSNNGNDDGEHCDHNDVLTEPILQPQKQQQDSHGWVDYFDSEVENEQEYVNTVHSVYNDVLASRQKERETLQLRQAEEKRKQEVQDQERQRLERISEEEDRVCVQRERERRHMLEEGKLVEEQGGIMDMNALEVRLAWAADDTAAWGAVEGDVVNDGAVGGKRRRRRKVLEKAGDVVKEERIPSDTAPDIATTTTATTTTDDTASVQLNPDLDYEQLAVLGPLEPSCSPLPEPPLPEDEEEIQVAVPSTRVQAKDLFFGTDTSFFNDSGYFLHEHASQSADQKNLVRATEKTRALNTYELKRKKEIHRSVESQFDANNSGKELSSGLESSNESNTSINDSLSSADKRSNVMPVSSSEELSDVIDSNIHTTDVDSQVFLHTLLTPRELENIKDFNATDLLALDLSDLSDLVDPAHAKIIYDMLRQ